MTDESPAIGGWNIVAARHHVVVGRLPGPPKHPVDHRSMGPTTDHHAAACDPAAAAPIEPTDHHSGHGDHAHKCLPNPAVNIHGTRPIGASPHQPRCPTAARDRQTGCSPSSKAGDYADCSSAIRPANSGQRVRRPAGPRVIGIVSGIGIGRPNPMSARSTRSVTSPSSTRPLTCSFNSSLPSTSEPSDQHQPRLRIPKISR